MLNTFVRKSVSGWSLIFSILLFPIFLISCYTKTALLQHRLKAFPKIQFLRHIRCPRINASIRVVRWREDAIYISILRSFFSFSETIHPNLGMNEQVKLRDGDDESIVVNDIFVYFDIRPSRPPPLPAREKHWKNENVLRKIKGNSFLFRIFEYYIELIFLRFLLGYYIFSFCGDNEINTNLI